MTTALSVLKTLGPNPNWAKLPLFDRKGWPRVQFGDVVVNLNETCDPVEADIERFIGLEHLEPGSLHIRAWGNVADGTTFTRRCRPGQVLFGKRRAYQRKVAVAEFDAVVSGDIYVFVPKNDRLLSELLPFLCLSERFFQHAVGTSAGSLSPRTNWSSLASFEFGLPPLDQQQHIAEILWAVDEMQQQYEKMEQTIQQARTATIEEHFAQTWLKSRVQPLAHVAHVTYGITLGGYRTNLPVQKPYLRVANVLREQLDLSEIKEIRCTENEAAKFALQQGDVLIVEGHANVEEIGRVAVWRSEQNGMLHQNHLIRVQCSTKLLPNYLSLYANSLEGRSYFRKRAKSSSGLNTINSTVVKEFPIPVPDSSHQSGMTREVERFDCSRAAVAEIKKRLRLMMKEFFNTLFL